MLDWASSLESEIGHPVDLVDLWIASPILAHQVLTKGKALVVRSPRSVRDFIARTLTEYEDLKRTRRLAERALLERRHG